MRTPATDSDLRNVDYLPSQLTRSNASHVLITSVVAANTGKYSCEVSADAPSFHTQIMFKEMTVVGE